MNDIWATAAAVLVSLGGGGAVVWGFSGFLGKIWADRLMARERQTYQESLEALRDELRARTDRDLTQLKAQLELEHRYRYHEFADKLALYRAVVELVADVIVDAARAAENGTFDAAVLDQFERRRLRLYGYLGMIAPQAVMTALDALMDDILDMLEGKILQDFALIRERAYSMLNEIRQDVALDKSPVTYTGRR